MAETKVAPRLLVIGGCGELGWEVVRASTLPASPFARTVATYRTTKPTDAQREATPTVTWVQLDCGNYDEARSVLQSSEAAAVVYCAVPKHGGAAGKGSDEVRRGIVDEVVNLARAAAAVDVRFVAISTDLVFDGKLPAGKRYAEDSAVSPTSFYGIAKADMEKQLLGFHNTCIARTSLILTLGPPGCESQQHGKGIKFVVDALEGALPGRSGAFTMFTDELRCMSFSDDLAAALVELARPSRSFAGIVHVVADEVATRYDLACRLAALLDKRSALGRNVQPGLSADSGLNRPLNCALRTDLVRLLLSGTGIRIRGISERLCASG